MNTLDSIRETGTQVAYKYGIYEQPKFEEISLPNDLIEDFIGRVEKDLFKFFTLQQFDTDYFNLFSRAFMYVYGKGAEFAYFTRTGNNISRINYDFDKAMQGVCGEKLPDDVRFRINQKASAMLEMYVQMYEHTRGSQDKIISEGLNFRDCIYTILNGAFFYGTYVCLTVPISGDDNTNHYEEPQNDKPYNNATYNKRYQPQDYRLVNVKFGDFNEIKDKFGLR
jgi:hypothetical protein